MCDQAPAALINDVVVTNLTPEKAKEIAKKLKDNPDPEALVTECGDGNNANELVKSMVNNNICQKGDVVFAEREAGSEESPHVRLWAEGGIEPILREGFRGDPARTCPT